jgi:hypothetical protein
MTTAPTPPCDEPKPKTLQPKQLAWCRENLSGFQDLETITAGMTGEAAKKLPVATELRK